MSSHLSHAAPAAAVPLSGASVRMQAGFRPKLLAVTIHMVLAGGLLAASPMAQVQAASSEVEVSSQQASTVRAYAIPAGPLEEALAYFVAESGTPLAASPKLVQGKQSRGVRGNFSAQAALEQLLAGTSLRATPQGDGGYVLREAPTTSSVEQEMDLPMLMVEATAMNSNSTFELPEAYAGGQVATGGQVGMLGNRDVMDTPFSQISYTNQTIQNQQARTVNEVLNNDPSVITTDGAARYDSDNIRGFTQLGNRGVRSLNGLAGMAPMELPSADYIERVEVLKGPSALLNGMAAMGSGNIGGSISLTTKQAGDEPITTLTTRYVPDSQLGAHIDVGRRFGADNELGIRFNGSLDEGNTPVDSQKSRDGNAALNLDYRGERVRLSSDIVHQSGELEPPTNQLSLRSVFSTLSEVPRPPSNSTSIFHPSTETSTKSTLGMVRGEFDITDNVTTYAAIGKQRFERNDEGPQFPWLLDESGSAMHYTYSERSINDVLSMQGGVRATLDTGPVAHALSFNLSQVITARQYKF